MFFFLTDADGEPRDDPQTEFSSLPCLHLLADVYGCGWSDGGGLECGEQKGGRKGGQREKKQLRRSNWQQACIPYYSPHVTDSQNQRIVPPPPYNAIDRYGSMVLFILGKGIST